MTLADYGAWIRRRWWLMVLGLAVGLAGAAAYTAVQPLSYTSTASVLLQPVGLNAGPNARVNLDTEAQLLRSEAVAGGAQSLMGTSIPTADLRRSVTVTVPPNSQVMQVTFVAGTPELARDGAQSFAQAHLDLRADTARRGVEAEIAGLQEQIDRASAALADASSRIATTPSESVEQQRADADRIVLTQQLTGLNDRLSPLLTAQLVPGSVITDAFLPRRSSGPSWTLNLLSGVVAGLLLGVLAALVLDRFDRRIRRRRDLTSRLGVHVLVDLTQGRSGRSAARIPLDEAARDFSRLRNVLQADAGTTRGVHRILVSAVDHGPAAGAVVDGLARALARAGARVAVVGLCADSALSHLAEPSAGLAGVLRGSVPLQAALRQVPEVEHIHVLPAGDLPVDDETPAAEILKVVDELAADSDAVLVETPSPGQAPEVQALGRSMDTVLLVVEAAHSTKDGVALALEMFEQVGASVAGAVLVGRPARPASPSGSGPERPVEVAAAELPGSDVEATTRLAIAGPARPTGPDEETATVAVHRSPSSGAMAGAAGRSTTSSVALFEDGGPLGKVGQRRTASDSTANSTAARPIKPSPTPRRPGETAP